MARRTYAASFESVPCRLTYRVECHCDACEVLVPACLDLFARLAQFRHRRPLEVRRTVVSSVAVQVRHAVFPLGLRHECFGDESVHEAVSAVLAAVAERDVLSAGAVRRESEWSQIFVADISEVTHLIVVEVLYGSPFFLINRFHSINIFY